MTTSKYVYGKITETHLVQRNSENHGKKYKEIKKWNAKKKLKNVKCVWEEMITYKNKLVKIFKAKTKC